VTLPKPAWKSETLLRDAGQLKGDS